MADNFNLTNLSVQSQSTVVTETYRNWDIWEKLLLALLIFGTIGNILTIIVMRSKRMRKSNESLFITTIAILDMSLLMIKFFVNMQKIYRIKIYSACIYIQYVVPQTIAWLVYWLIVVVTIERYIAVSKPFDVVALMSKKRCKFIILGLLIFFTALSTQAICLKSDPKRPHYCTLDTFILYKNTTKSVDICSIYMKSVFPWIKSALMSWIPWLPALIFNILILVSLSKSKKLRNKIITIPNSRNGRNLESMKCTEMSSLHGGRPINSSINGENKKTNIISRLKFYRQELKEKQITITLCTISFTFILFTAPFAIIELMRKISLSKNLKTFFNNRDLHRVGHFLLDCLHVTNFIFYCVIARRFRLELTRVGLQKLYCGSKRRKDQAITICSQYTSKSFL